MFDPTRRSFVEPMLSPEEVTRHLGKEGMSPRPFPSSREEMHFPIRRYDDWNQMVYRPKWAGRRQALSVVRQIHADYDASLGRLLALDPHKRLLGALAWGTLK